MAKFEAVIDLTVEVDSDDSDSADKKILGELTDKILAIAGSEYKIWIDVRQIEEVQ
jgi:Uma2 family endonuclease